MKPIVPFVLLTVIVANTTTTAQTTRPWNGKKCAVVLTYDDALNVHLDNVVPALDAYGFKGTFYLIASAPVVANRLEEWRTIAKNGHELGNHTLNHPCDGTLPNREWVHPEADLSRYSIERAVHEIKMTNTFLTAIDGKTERTFAYPCVDLNINGKPYYNGLENDFVGARGATPTYPTAKEVDLNNINGFVEISTTAQHMIAEIEAAEKAGSFIVFIFHGVGGEHALNVETAEHQKVLDYLHQKQNDIWVATMADVANYIKKEQGK